MLCNMNTSCFAVSHVAITTMPDHCLCLQVYQTGLLSVRDAKAMLPGISSSLLGLFQSQRHPACLDVLADCVEYYARDADVNNLFSHVLYVVCSAAEPVMQVCVPITTSAGRA